jgi:hypothetical protein
MPLKFEKRLIADERYESAGVFDVNNDGFPDIVSGAYWYEGPDFTKQHFIGEVRAEGEYFDDFSTIPMDINRDGYLDFVTGGWWGDTLRWRENPGLEGGEWPEHIIAECGSIEGTRAWDVNGDGVLDIVPNTPMGPLVVYSLGIDESGRRVGPLEPRLVLGEKQGHGLGFGDVSGNGRGDFVLTNGWFEAPEDAFGYVSTFHEESDTFVHTSKGWVFHEEFDLGSASLPVIVADVNGDGLSDLIVGQAHDYGLDWWEQGRDADGARIWTKHPIDPYNSQYHDMQWVDIDGDGECELVTGKRYRAHCGRDPGAADPVGIYYFKWNCESFSKQIIDYGPARVGTGLGIMFATADLRGAGRLDIVAPGKDGLYVFFNRGD